LAALKAAALEHHNTFEPLMEACKVCTLGQVSRALYEVGGQYRRNMQAGRAGSACSTPVPHLRPVPLELFQPCSRRGWAGLRLAGARPPIACSCGSSGLALRPGKLARDLHYGLA